MRALSPAPLTKAPSPKGLFLGGATLLIAALFAILNPAGALAFVLGPFSSAYAIGNLLDAAAVLAIAAAGASLSLKAGIVNLGGEGQFYLGALVGQTLFFSLRQYPSPLVSLIAALSAFAAAAALGGISSFMKARFGTGELITSFLVSAALVPVLDWAVAGPMRDSSSQLMATAAIAAPLAFARLLPPSSLNANIFLAPAAVFGLWIFLQRTRRGFEIRMLGLSRRFSEASGLRVVAAGAMAMAIGAGVFGLAGIWNVQGSSGRVFMSFAGGRGFTALACAIASGGNPVLILPMSLVFTYLEAGARSAQILSGIPAEIASIMQALLILAVAARTGGKAKNP